MSIDQLDKIDFAGVDPASGDFWLTITDHHNWDKDVVEHLWALQEKINLYLGYIERGDLYVDFPDAKGRNIVVNIVGKFVRNEKGLEFYSFAASKLNEAGIVLRYETMYPN